MTKTIIEILEKQIKLHKSLHKIGKEKTEVIKKGNMEELQNLLKSERTHIGAINIVEKERQQLVAELLPNREEANLTNCLSMLSEQNREKAESLREQLLEEITNLKETNSLNQMLLEQSLQWVNFNLGLVLPDNPNYTKEQDEGDSMPKVSLFDSKA